MTTASIPPDALQAEIATGTPVDLIDVRTAAEFAQTHAASARNLPLSALDAGRLLAERRAPAGAPLYLICHTGARAAEAAERLRAAGCEHPIVVEGGTLAWERAGLPVVAGRRRGLNVQRQTQLCIGLGVLTGALLGALVDPRLAYIAAFFGAGLTMAGLTGACPLASAIAAMPWNKGDCSSCTVAPSRPADAGASPTAGGAAS